MKGPPDSSLVRDEGSIGKVRASESDFGNEGRLRVAALYLRQRAPRAVHANDSHPEMTTRGESVTSDGVREPL